MNCKKSIWSFIPLFELSMSIIISYNFYKDIGKCIILSVDVFKFP
jgi:hypothetical protein